MNTSSKSRTVVIKFGGSIAPEEDTYIQLAAALVEFQRRTKLRVVVAVSARQGRTKQLIHHAKEDFPGNLWAQANAVARGEDDSATRLLEELIKLKASAQLLTAPEIGLLGAGEADPFHGKLLGIDADQLAHLVARVDITVIAGYYALHQTRHRKILLGPNATDLIAAALAGALHAPCFLCKEGGYVFMVDPRLVPGRSPRKFSRLSRKQALVCAKIGYPFLMVECLEWAEKEEVRLYFMSSPVAKDCWRAGAMIGDQPAKEGIFVGVQEGNPACVSVVQWGQSLNGHLEELVLSSVRPIDIRSQDNQTSIYVPPDAVSPLVNVLAEELNLLEPVA